MSIDFTKTIEAVSKRIPVFAVPASWGGISGKPAKFPPSDHNHNDQYFTKTQINELLAGKMNILGVDDAGVHNSIYRGKSLGSLYTAAQKNAITAGTFKDLYIGDYWTINGKTWRIWAFDYFFHKGDTSLTAHHALIMPDTNLLNGDGSTTHYMNSTATTEGGYKATEMRSTYLPQCLTIIENAFGAANILEYKEIISNAVSDGKASGWEWVSTKIEIPNEVMMYGSIVWGQSTVSNGSGYNVGANNSQLPLALVRPDLISNRNNFWLRDVVSASSFAYVNRDGYAFSSSASLTWVGVRPLFLLS